MPKSSPTLTSQTLAAQQHEASTASLATVTRLSFPARAISFLGLVSIAMGCGGDSQQSTDAALPVIDAAQAIDAASIADARTTPLKFVLTVSNDVPESIYVQLNREEGRTSWVQVTKDGAPVILQDRCEIIDCVNPSGVCGAAQPRVKDITGGTSTGSITLESDGRMSVVDSELSCETLEPLPDGAYIATFCWALSAEFDGKGDPASDNGTAGSVVTPSCANVPFDFPGDTEVLHSILGG